MTEASSVTNVDGTPFQAPPRLTPGAVRQARLMLGWSQVDLAAKIKVSSTAVSNFECGRSRWRPRHERALVDVFAERGVDLEGGSVRLRVPRRAAAAD